jgi:hypothetical protein
MLSGSSASAFIANARAAVTSKVTIGSAVVAVAIEIVRPIGASSAAFALAAALAFAFATASSFAFATFASTIALVRAFASTSPRAVAVRERAAYVGRVTGLVTVLALATGSCVLFNSKLPQGFLELEVRVLGEAGPNIQLREEIKGKPPR